MEDNCNEEFYLDTKDFSEEIKGWEDFAFSGMAKSFLILVTSLCGKRPIWKYEYEIVHPLTNQFNLRS